MPVSSSKQRFAISFPKEDYIALNQMQNSLYKEGISCTKSDILLQAFRDYLKLILATGKMYEDEKQRKDKEVIKDA